MGCVWDKRLLPCPFCGSSARLLSQGADPPSWSVDCLTCGAKILTFAQSPVCAVASWNRRSGVIDTSLGGLDVERDGRR